MTAKQYLRQGYLLDHRIAIKVQELQNLRDTEQNITVAYDRERVQSSPTPHSMENKIIKITDLESKIQAEIDVLLRLKNQIHDTLENLNSPLEQLVLTYRYVQSKSWEEIAEIMDKPLPTIYRWHTSGIKRLRLPKNPINIFQSDSK